MEYLKHSNRTFCCTWPGKPLDSTKNIISHLYTTFLLSSPGDGNGLIFAFSCYNNLSRREDGLFDEILRQEYDIIVVNVLNYENNNATNLFVNIGLEFM